MREKVVALEYHSDLLAHFVKAWLAVFHRFAVEFDRATLDRFQTIYTAEQGTFSAAGRTNQNKHFSLFNAERKIIDDRVVAESFCDMIYVNNVFSHVIHPSFLSAFLIAMKAENKL